MSWFFRFFSCSLSHWVLPGWLSSQVIAVQSSSPSRFWKKHKSLQTWKILSAHYSCPEVSWLGLLKQNIKIQQNSYGSIYKDLATYVAWKNLKDCTNSLENQVGTGWPIPGTPRQIRNFVPQTETHCGYIDIPTRAGHESNNHNVSNSNIDSERGGRGERCKRAGRSKIFLPINHFFLKLWINT